MVKKLHGKMIMILFSNFNALNNCVFTTMWKKKLHMWLDIHFQ